MTRIRPWFDALDLERLLADLESDFVERKESFRGDAPTKIREAVCAFANDLPDHQRPGVVFLGITDSGSPSALHIDDELLRALADIKTDGSIVPPPTLTVDKQHLLGHEVAVIQVQPADAPPVRYKGRIFIRIGPRRGIASAQDERLLNEKRRAGDRPFDVSPVPETGIGDLSGRHFEEEYLPAAFDPEILAANERSLEQRLAATKMIAGLEDPRATVLGLLVIGLRPRDHLPGAYIQFLRVEGRDLSSSVVDELVVDGTLDRMVRRIEDKLAAHNRTSVDFTSERREKRRSLYPEPALQQIVRNAVMHRSYQGTHAPIRVIWFEDRLEISNPGGPFGTVTTESFGEPGLVDYRNPGIAEALRVLGLVQRFGAGIAIAQRSLEMNGNPQLEFRVSPHQVTAILRPAKLAASMI